MRRYRLFTLYIDPTRNYPELFPLNELVAAELGERKLKDKLKRFMDLKKPVFTIVGEYRFLQETERWKSP